MKTAIVTFLSVFFTNVLYAYYLKAVQKNERLLASVWSASINIVASVAVIGYIENHWMLIPACVGSFTGTYAGMLVSIKIKRRNVA